MQKMFPLYMVHMSHYKEKGGLKNTKGMKRPGVILTFYETMRMRGIHPHTELVKIL